MLESVLLDVLLVLAMLLLVPIGVLRGGVREVCSAAGLLLGIMIADAWVDRWGGWIADAMNVDPRGTRLAVAVLCIVGTMAIVGYGGASAFTWHPGPGGKVFGAAIAVINGVVLAGFVVNSVARYINQGSYPEIVEKSVISRALSEGFDWVLLFAGAGVLLLSILGMIVREREPEDHAWAAQTSHQPPRHSVRQVLPTRPYAPNEGEKVEPASPPPDPTGPEFAPVKVREVRHWEDDRPAPAPGTTGGWRQTWPKDAAGQAVRVPWAPAEEPRKQPEAFRKVPPANEPQQTERAESLKDWIAREHKDDDRGS